MELSIDLNKKIIDFLTTIPGIHDSDTQQALIYRAGLNPQLQAIIHVGNPPAQFVPLLVETLLKHGTLEDGRNPLEAVLETAKNFIGQNRRAYCDTLIQELRAVQDPSTNHVQLTINADIYGALNTEELTELLLQAKLLLHLPIFKKFNLQFNLTLSS